MISSSSFYYKCIAKAILYTNILHTWHMEQYRFYCFEYVWNYCNFPPSARLRIALRTQWEREKHILHYTICTQRENVDLCDTVIC